MAQYRALTPDQKEAIKRVLRYPCSYCEKEFNVPNLGLSHGMCIRHNDEMRAQFGMKPSPVRKSNVVDLKEMPKPLLDIAVKIASLLHKKHNAKEKTRWDDFKKTGVFGPPS